MREYCKERLFVVLIFFTCLPLSILESSAKGEEKLKNKLITQDPRYELELNLNEFSVLNSSVVGGVKKYGGEAEFGLKMTKKGDEIVWTVTITNPKLIEVLGYWTAEKSAELVNSLDINNLDATSKLALATMKSLNEKVTYAQKNPLWVPVRLSGMVVEENGVLFIEGQEGKYQATGNHLEELEKRRGKRIIAVGYVKVKDQIEVNAFLDVKENTLELFVMSLCPFARMAEASILDFLDTYPGKSKPALEIRYIFYKKNEGENSVFSSMHGKEEIRENLVQIVIRDNYPQFYHNYLLKRVDDNDTPWDELAKATGMKDKDIKSIERTIAKERETLIQKEYDYITGTYQIYDGSPTYVWECEKVADITKVEAFEGLKFSSDRCSEETK